MALRKHRCFERLNPPEQPAYCPVKSGAIFLLAVVGQYVVNGPAIGERRLPAILTLLLDIATGLQEG